MHSFRLKALRPALFAGAAALISLVAPVAAQAEETETVVVTGSRIPQANLVSSSPVVAVTAKEFQYKGATDVSNMLNDLPQTFISNTGDFANANNPLSSPGGVTTIDLRGLGPTRTLVLVNGRRLGVGDPNTGNPNAAPDIDQIPVPLIERVEVLTGGASSTYGSDAVAGVVNFIMKNDFEGIQVDGHYGGYWHDNSNHQARDIIAQGIATNTQGPLRQAPDTVWDGDNNSESIIMGANAPDGKGNVTGYFVYRHAEPVWQRNRDFSDCQIDIVAVGPGGSFCAGSSNSNYFEPGGPGNPVYSVVGHQFLPRPQPGSFPPSSVNSNQWEALARGDERYMGGFFAHYDINSMIRPYTEFMFMDDRSLTSVAPDAIFRTSNFYDPAGLYHTNCDNPLLSGQERGLLCAGAGPTDTVALDIGRRDFEGGARVSTYEHQNFRGVAGIKGDIAEGWHYDVFGSYYYVTVDQLNTGYYSNSRLNNALLVNPDGTCQNGGIDGCVPYNIWQQGGVTQAALNYLLIPGTSRGTLQEEIYEGDVTGDLGTFGWSSPWAKEGVQVAFGGTNRKTKLIFQADQAEQSGDLLGFGGAAVPVNNAINVTEFYGETRVPLIEEMEWAQDLELDAGIRFSHYTNGTGPTTWKVGGQWQPIADLRFRTSYDVAIRAASILESFTPTSVTNTSIVSVDPCAPTVNGNGVAIGPATASLAACEHTGVTPAEYGNGFTTNRISQCVSGQCSVLLGGNPLLGPEKAKTFSVGASLTPTFFDGFTASIDYFKIDIGNTVVQNPIDVALNDCLNNGTSCGFVVRDPAGSLHGTNQANGGFIVGTFVNAGSSSVSGMDLQADYLVNTDDWGMNGWGSLAFHFVGTATTTGKITLPGQPTYDCIGLFGNTCGNPLPYWRHVLRVTWESPWDVSLSANWRYFGHAGNQGNTNRPVIGGAFDPANPLIPSMSYMDLTGIYNYDEHWEFRAGINNVFDTDPKLISNLITGTGTPNVYNSYDVLGREVFFEITAKY